MISFSIEQRHIFKLYFNHFKKYGYFALSVNRFDVFHQYKLCYSDIPKAASTSIRTLLYEHFFKKKPNDDIHYLYRVKNINSFNFQNKNCYFSFSIVRNPFERIVSAYKDKFQKGQWSAKTYLFGIMDYGLNFDSFVKWICLIPERFAEDHFVSQYAILYDKKGKCRVEHIGKFEELNTFWKNVVQKHRNLPDLPHHNSTKKSDWRDFYTPKTAKMIYNRYKKDFETFGYEEEYNKLIIYLKEKSESK